MERIAVSKYNLSEVLSQVLDDVREQILETYKMALEQALESVRDKVIGNKRYHRGFAYKRWGYTIRKWIQTPIGMLYGVRIPRIRGHGREIGVLLGRYLRRSREIDEILLEGYLWGLSSRRLRLWARRVFGDVLSHSSLCRLKHLIRDRVNSYRNEAISDDIRAIVVDGLWGHYRRGGRGVVLVALGVTTTGKVRLLDWLACEREDKSSYLKLFRRLEERGLKSLELLVSDGISGLDDCLRWVWGSHVRHQLCLWHFQVDLVRHLQDKSFVNRSVFESDYWKVFDAIDENDAMCRLREFYHRWELKVVRAISLMKQREARLLHFYSYPAVCRRVLRTTNIAESFFSNLQRFLKRFPGWIDEEHISYILGVHIIGTEVFRVNFNNIHAQKIPSSIIGINFNRIY